MATNQPTRDLETTQPEDDDLLDADEVGEEIEEDDDHPMEDDEDVEIQEEIAFQNDSIAHFDAHTDSIFCIAQHPSHPNIIVTGGGDDLAYIYDATVEPGPVLPSSYQSDPSAVTERQSQTVLKKLDGHTDSVNAIAFTYPHGEYVLTAGLDGKLRAYRHTKPADPSAWTFLVEASEVEEINWLTPNPSPTNPNVVALGASDGSVWVYKVDASDAGNELNILMTQYLHTTPCTAGTWTPDGKYLATVSEDSTLYVWDVFGTGQPIITLTAEDQRFAVEGGLYSVAATTSLVAVGGAGGNIRVIGLPQPSTSKPGTGASKKSKSQSSQSQSQSQASSAGQILASLQVQSDSVETLSFSQPPLTLLASGSVDGSIALFDTAHRFALRRHINEAHEDQAVVKLDFLRSKDNTRGFVLTSAGMDGVVRRWDVRGGTTAAGQGFIREWKGHRGGGEGGGVLGFVQGGTGNIVTAGDDGISLVFKGDV